MARRKNTRFIDPRYFMDEKMERLDEWGDTRHQDMEMCDDKVPKGFGRNSDEYKKCLEHPEAYEPPDPTEHELYEATDPHDQPAGGESSKKELQAKCAKEGGTWKNPDDPGYDLARGKKGYCEKKKKK